MKVHLYDSNDPLKSGATLTANCGTEIANAEFAFMFDLNLWQEGSLRSLLCCQTCCAARMSKRYIYGVVSGQEVMTREVA